MSSPVYMKIDKDAFINGVKLEVTPDDIAASVDSAILSFPNDTMVTLRGDGDVIKQIIKHLDGLIVEYEVKS